MVFKYKNISIKTIKMYTTNLFLNLVILQINSVIVWSTVNEKQKNKIKLTNVMQHNWIDQINNCTISKVTNCIVKYKNTLLGSLF